MKKIIVKSCGDCPFFVFEENSPYGSCIEIVNVGLRDGYHESIDDRCPLKKEPVQIEIGE